MPQYTPISKLKIAQAVGKAKFKKPACDRRGVSYNSAMRWIALSEGKSKAEALEALANKSRKPKRSPNMTEPTKRLRVIELRAANLGRDHIVAKMRREGFQIGKSAVEGVLRRQGAWNKRERPKRKQWKSYTPLLRYPGQKCQLDIKYVPFRINGERCYQFTIVDLYTRMTFRAIYDEKTPDNSADFLCHAIEYFPFRIRVLQTDNGTEFTYRCQNFRSEHPLDPILEKYKIKRSHIPVATPRYNGVVENVHGRDQQEFYDCLDKNIPKCELKQKIRERNRFWNRERLHSSLKYVTPKERLNAYIAKHGKPKSKFQYVSR